MRHIIMLLTVSLLLLSCGQNDAKQKELDLRERELALKEKELALKEKDTNTLKISTTDKLENKVTQIDKKNQDTISKAKEGLPFIGTKKFCIVKNENQAHGSFDVTIKEDGTVIFTAIMYDNMDAQDGWKVPFHAKLKNNKAGNDDSFLVFKSKEKFEYVGGGEDGFTAIVCK